MLKRRLITEEIMSCDETSLKNQQVDLPVDLEIYGTFAIIQAEFSLSQH